jgi:hypothetical protein
MLTILALWSIDGHAQWLNHATVGIPRTADGKPELSAPAPRLPDGTPDLSGFWNQPLAHAYAVDITTDLRPEDVTPAASKLYRERLSEFSKDDPGNIGCLPSGTRHILGGLTASRVRIVQTPMLIAMLFEDLAHRQIHMDGRALPDDPNPSFMGFSVGRWEADTLVVETIGFNGRTWLDVGGHPHGERLKVIERFRRVTFGRVERQITLIDDEFYKQPIVVQASMNFAADTDMLEYVCNENPRSRPHLVGRTAQERKVAVGSDILRRYVGTYDAAGQTTATAIRQYTVFLENGQLFLAFNGQGHVPMVPMSDTTFSASFPGTIEFVSDTFGNVTHLVSHAPEFTRRYDRRQ